jgi:hypothetical protein
MATRAELASSTLMIDAPDAVARRIDDFLAARAELTALDLYYELERATSLLEFHSMLRDGERNRASSGLQQSYGDHNRLLMLGLDRLLEGDVEWYHTRLAPNAAVSEASLGRCLATARSLAPSREIRVALWLGAALHDCGMLCGRGSYVDVEDGIVLSRPVIDALCPAPYRGLASAVLHHHDYIKGVFLGEVPVARVADEIEALDRTQRAIALAGLGLVQVAGAASLGEGRLEAFRIQIFERCVKGDALDDRTSSTRLARLLAGNQDAGPRPTDGVDAQLASLDALLAHASVHAWQRATASASEPERLALLAALAQRWAASGCDDVVFEGGHLPTGVPDVDHASFREERALSGVRLLAVHW